MTSKKTLYLIRHAKSKWDEQDVSDLQRTLNKRGSTDAPLMGKILKVSEVNPDLILCSPAARAYITAEIFANELSYNKDKIETDERIYNSTMTILMNVLRDINDKFKTVLLFGHNPGLTNTANLLGDKFIPDLPTCAIVGIKLNIISWSETERHCGNIFFYEYPKKSLK